jgi:hypothetical protein
MFFDVRQLSSSCRLDIIADLELKELPAWACKVFKKPKRKIVDPGGGGFFGP